MRRHNEGKVRHLSRLHTLQQDAEGVVRLTPRRALQSTLQRVRGASATVKRLIVDRFEQGDGTGQDLVDVFWQLKDTEQALARIARRCSEGRRAG